LPGSLAAILLTRASHPYYQPGVIVSGNENLLELRDVAKTYGEHQVQALKHVNLVVRKGSFACLMGQSGCGKSTLLNIIAGLDSPSSGSVVFDGIDMSALKDEEVTRIRGEKIGFVFQFFNLLSTLTVEENVSLPLELTTNLSHKARRAKVLEMLERVGMQNRIDFFPAQLSGGEMQRVAIARALVHSPRLLVADEPTGNLDSANGTMVLDLLKELNSDLGQTIVMATHSQEAGSCGDSMILMKDGAIVSQTSTRPGSD